MHTSHRFFLRFAFTIACLALGMSLYAESDKVKLVRVPDGGIQPQAVVDVKGVVHLVYFKGEAKADDLFYVRQGPEGFSKPIQVNSKPGSGIAVGTIRGAQLALGRN